MNGDCCKAYENCKSKPDEETAISSTKALDKNRQERWTTLMESLNVQKISRKAWALLKKLSGERTATRKEEAVDPNKIAG